MPARGAGPAAGGVDDECDGSPDVRARRADWCHPLLSRRTQRGDVRPGVHQLLGHLLRRTGGALGARRGGGGGRAVLQLRSRRGGSPHSEGVAHHHACSGDRVDTPAFARAAELLIKAATSAPFEGRPIYAALRAIPIPDDVVARFFHAGSLLREHRGDGHIAALMIEGVGGLEAHVLLALDMGMPAEKFGRIHHLPATQLAAVIDGMRDRGLIGDDGWLSEPGRAVKQRVEALTDDLAARPYQSLEPDELDELMTTLGPLATLLLAARD